MKEYLGDGVHAEYDHVRDQIIVTTSDGIRTTNTIYLDGDTWQALKSFVSRTMDL